MSKKCHKTTIGGQAIIEGVMMRGVENAAMAVRMPDGTIDVEQFAVPSLKQKKWYMKTPVIRGSFHFVESLKLGYQCLMKSAEKSGEGEEYEEPSRFEKWLMDKLGDRLFSVFGTIGIVLGVFLSLFLFMYLPTLITAGIGSFVKIGMFRSTIEAAFKILFIVGYMIAISKIGYVKTLFSYHGAEHKTIACYENGLPLTIENAKEQTRFHPRCGTSFILIVFLVSIFVFLFVPPMQPLVRSFVRIALLPLVVGIAYEIIKLAGRYGNLLTRIVSKPGVWLQKITTNEPDDKQLEVAIAALNAVLTDNKEDDQW